MMPICAWIGTRFLPGISYNSNINKSNYFVFKNESYSRRTRHSIRHDQLFYTHINVWILFCVRPGTTVPKIFMVEKTFNNHANGKYSSGTIYLPYIYDIPYKC